MNVTSSCTVYSYKCVLFKAYLYTTFESSNPSCGIGVWRSFVCMLSCSYRSLAMADPPSRVSCRAYKSVNFLVQSGGSSVLLQLLYLLENAILE